MVWIANLLWSIGCLPWLAMVLSAKPTRGENLTGIHVVTGPAALPAALAAALHLLLARDMLGGWTWLGFGALPGHWVAMLALPIVATDRRHGTAVKAFAALAWASIGALGNPLASAPWLPWLGFAPIVVLGFAVYGAALRSPVRRVVSRLPIARGGRPPSEWELSQAEFQRGEWRRLPPEAGLDQLLPFVRSFAPEVKDECLRRIAARTDLAGAMAAALASDDDSTVLHYVVHHYPRPRRELAAAMSERLDRELARWTTVMARPDGASKWFGNLVGVLDAGVAVLRDGGNVEAPLRRWAHALADHPEYRALGRQVGKYLR